MSLYGVIFGKKLAPKVPVSCSPSCAPVVLNQLLCLPAECVGVRPIIITIIPAASDSLQLLLGEVIKCAFLCACLTQYKEDSLPSSNFLAVIYLLHSLYNLWVVWENNFRLCLRRLPAEAEKVWDLYSCFQEYFLMGVLYSVLHRKEKTKLSMSCSTAQMRSVWTNPCLQHAFTQWTFSTQTLTVLVEITGGEKLFETLPFTFQLQVCVLNHWHFTCNLIFITN